jgi:hypothetical protein
MKRILPVAIALLFAACASTPPEATNSAPRYATPEEIERLQKEARANLQREREQQGVLATIGSGPAVASSETPRSAPARTTPPSPPSRSWSVAEARYAMQIGKAPADLTAGERAAARSN